MGSMPKSSLVKSVQLCTLIPFLIYKSNIMPMKHYTVIKSKLLVPIKKNRARSLHKCNRKKRERNLNPRLLSNYTWHQTTLSMWQIIV